MLHSYSQTHVTTSTLIDPSDYFRAWYSKDGPQNYSRWSNKELEELLPLIDRELMLVQELAADIDADVARIAAAAIRLARAPEQHRPLAAVRDILTSSGGTPARRHQHGRTGRPSTRPGDRRRRPRSREAVSAAEG